MSSSSFFERVDQMTPEGQGFPLPFECQPVSPEQMVDWEVCYPAASCFTLERDTWRLYLHKTTVFDPGCRAPRRDYPRVAVTRVEPMGTDGELGTCGFLVDVRPVSAEHFSWVGEGELTADPDDLEGAEVPGYGPDDFHSVLGIVYFGPDGKTRYSGDLEFLDRATLLAETVDALVAGANSPDEAAEEAQTAGS